MNKLSKSTLFTYHKNKYKYEINRSKGLNYDNTCYFVPKNHYMR